MGTDTLAYCASALSFMFENLGKPVIVTGSQIPFMEVFSDARRNLILSLIMAAREELAEVCVLFHDRLMRGNRTCKTDSLSVAAFDSPNMPWLARIGVSIVDRYDMALPPPRGPFRTWRRRCCCCCCC